jgi:geranylgeranyl pyrophosphate synthase
MARSGRSWRRGDSTERATAAPDLGVDGPPCPQIGTEVWWFNTRLHDGDAEFGLVFYLMRHQATRGDGTRLDSHAVAWFRSDPTAASHIGETWLDSGAVELARAVIGTDKAMDPRVRRATLEALSHNRPPLPDRELRRPVRIGEQGLDLDFGGVGRLRMEDDGSYLVEADGEHSGFTLRLVPEKAAIGSFVIRGFVPATARRSSRCVPRLAVTGSFRREERRMAVKGRGWYERAVGDPWQHPRRGPNAPDSVWNRGAGLWLDNGWELAVTHGTDAPFTSPAVVLCSPEGERVEAEAVMRGSQPWTSLATLNTYDTLWDVEVTRLRLNLRVRAWFPQQEIRSMIFGAGMLQAQADVEGTMAGRPVHGQGLLAVFRSTRIVDFERFMTSIGDCTRAEIDRLYPEEPDAGALAALTGLEDRPQLLDDVGVADLHAALVQPIRHVTRGVSKSLRPYIMTAALGLLGVDGERYRPLLGAVEILHSAALIVDDVEDRSPMRRGRPAAHLVFGEPTAINAGNAAYFTFDRVLSRLLPADDQLRLRIYQAYMQAMRAVHAGQALDIAGHQSAMDTAVATGRAEPLLRRIRIAHRLKTAAVARCTAEISAYIAKASEARKTALAHYFEAVGLAFQINDDLMDLHGLSAPAGPGGRASTKHTAEDLRAGKVTMPLAHAVELVPAERMREIWRTVRTGDTDLGTVTKIVKTLEEHGAIDACRQEAHDLIEQAWGPVQSLFPVTYHSIMMRALGSYAAQRERE